MTHGNDYVNSMVLTNDVKQFHVGLTKREYFAAMAMQGFLSAQKTVHLDFLDMICIAEDSVKMTDQLIKALNKEK
jgi:hypothetical protein